MIKYAATAVLVLVLAGCSGPGDGDFTGCSTESESCSVGGGDFETSSVAVKIKVPNVVGKGHQTAQDLLQSKGFYGLAEEDATGLDRLIILDRNWVVVRQSPKAGTLADPNTVTITLYSKKVGE